jgi:hypothetical protein
MTDALFSRILSWPEISGGTLKEWAAGLVFILIVGFLWSTVIADIKG